MYELSVIFLFHFHTYLTISPRSVLISAHNNQWALMSHRAARNCISLLLMAWGSISFSSSENREMTVPTLRTHVISVLFVGFIAYVGNWSFELCMSWPPLPDIEFRHLDPHRDEIGHEKCSSYANILWVILPPWVISVRNRSSQPLIDDKLRWFSLIHAGGASINVATTDSITLCQESCARMEDDELSYNLKHLSIQWPKGGEHDDTQC